MLQLSTAWRNDPQILQAANRISDPLRASGQVKVEKLVKRPGVGDERGKVWAARVQDGLAEAELIAKFLASVGLQVNLWRCYAVPAANSPRSWPP